MKSTRRPAPLFAAALLPLCLAACKSHGLGKVPPTVAELYDQADPTGKMELEIDREGKLIEIETDIPIEALPPVVLEAAMSRAPGALVTGAEREINERGRMWEVKLWYDDRDWEFVIDDEGQIHEIEKRLFHHETPDFVFASADVAVPGGMLKSVEVIERGEEIEYHVKKDLDGASYKIVLDGTGMLLRKVREQLAEIEIPLM